MYDILIVEDDFENCDILARNFEKADGYRYTIAHNADEALTAVGNGHYDLILLDVMLPGMDGIELCVQLRKSLYCPIIFMSCMDDENTIVMAMRMGGDDYITKPFRFPILFAHIEAALRRMQFGNPCVLTDYTFGDMVLSIKEHAIIKGGERIPLSPTEFEMVINFLNNQNVVLRFEDIYQYIWKKPSLGDLRTLFSHVRNLRKKIEKDPSNPQHIVTVPRVGYIFSGANIFAMTYQ